MLWEALAERRMWQGHTENTVIRALVTGELPSLRDVVPGYPEYFYEIVERATAFEASGRFSTALEMQLEVERILGDLGGPVHPRELSAFMQAEFGEYRHQREAAIESAIQQSLPPPSLSGPTELLSSSQSITDVSRRNPWSGQARARRRKGFMFAAILIIAIAGLAASVVVKRHPPRVAPVAPSVSAQRTLPGSVHFSVASTPSGASVWLDGALVGVTPWVADIPAKKEPRHLELKADNFETVAKTILPSSDFAAEIMLEPLQPDAKVTHEDPGRNKHAKHGKVVVTPKPAAASPTPASANCTPPYTLSPDGIRTYKAECFGDGAR
jgi:hypothetical protein